MILTRFFRPTPRPAIVDAFEAFWLTIQPAGVAPSAHHLAAADALHRQLAAIPDPDRRTIVSVDGGTRMVWLDGPVILSFRRGEGHRSLDLSPHRAAHSLQPAIPAPGPHNAPERRLA